jgi:hypothetical protein
MCSVDIDSTGNHCREPISMNTNCTDVVYTYPTRHQTETSETRTNTKGTFTTELDSYQTERLVTRRDQSKVGTAEQIWRQGCELGLGVDTIGIEFHETVELLGSESTIKINNRTDGDELDRGPLVKSVHYY